MKKKIILLLYFTVVAFIVVNISGYIEKLHYSNKYSDRPIMIDSEFFVINSDVPYVDMSFIVGDNDLEDFTLMGIDSEDTNRYHVLYSKGKYDIFYGNVSSEWDFDGYDTGAVIGKNGDVPDAKILDYIDDDGIYAKSRAVFMFDRKISEVGTNEIFALASGKIGVARIQFEKFSRLCSKHGISVTSINMQSAVFGQYSKHETVIYLIGIVFGVVVLFLAGVASHIWFSSNRNYFRVLFMFGAKHPYMAVAAGFLMVSIFAYVLQLILYLILSDSSYIIRRNTVIVSLVIYFSQYIVLLRYPGSYKDIDKK